MKTQLTKPARSKARYTEEYKKEALELWRASGRSAAKVAAELGIRVPVKSLFDHLEAGDSIEQFLEGFPSVKREQVIALLEEAREHALSAS
jgi:transposase-like protein